MVLVTAALALGSACGRIGFEVPIQFDPDEFELGVVEPTYASAADWNSYVRAGAVGGSTYREPGVWCDGSETGTHRACVHGGEHRRVVLAGAKGCDRLVARDDLGALQWTCAVESGEVVFYSTGLQPSRGLADLVYGTGWRPNAVVVEYEGEVIATTVPEVWWANPVEPLPENTGTGLAFLDQPGMIYVADRDILSDGYHIDADRIAVVVQ